MDEPICGDDYTYLEPVCPLFFGLQPSKRRTFPIKTGVIYGFQVYEYIYIDDTIYLYCCFMFFLFEGLIQDESCLCGEESTTKGSFYILQYLFHDGVL